MMHYSRFIPEDIKVRGTLVLTVILMLQIMRYLIVYRVIAMLIVEKITLMLSAIAVILEELQINYEG